MSRYRTFASLRFWKKFAIMDGPRIDQARAHRPTAPQPFTRSQAAPRCCFVWRLNLFQHAGRSAGLRGLRLNVGRHLGQQTTVLSIARQRSGWSFRSSAAMSAALWKRSSGRVAQARTMTALNSMTRAMSAESYTAVGTSGNCLRSIPITAS